MLQPFPLLEQLGNANNNQFPAVLVYLACTCLCNMYVALRSDVPNKNIPRSIVVLQFVPLLRRGSLIIYAHCGRRLDRKSSALHSLFLVSINSTNNMRDAYIKLVNCICGAIRIQKRFSALKLIIQRPESVSVLFRYYYQNFGECTK